MVIIEDNGQTLCYPPKSKCLRPPHLFSTHCTKQDETIPQIPPVVWKCSGTGFHTNKNKSRRNDCKPSGEARQPGRLLLMTQPSSAAHTAMLLVRVTAPVGVAFSTPIHVQKEKIEAFSAKMMPLVCLLNHDTPYWKLISEVLRPSVI